MKKTVYIVVSFVFLIVLWLIWTNFNITTTNIQIENKKIPSEFDTFKIAQVSDLHNHQWKGKLIEKIKKANPDIIAITGDLVDSSKTDFNIALEFIEEASKICPIYYVTGNHEAWLEDYSILRDKLEENGVNMMDNKSLFIEKAREKIQILGLEDQDFFQGMDERNIQGEMVSPKVSELLNKNYFNILLSHRPDLQEYVNLGLDLVLTGHAHGGQVRIPFLGGLVAPDQGFLPKYTEGLYNGKNTDMVVSRGLGNSIIAVRVNNTPELVIIELKRK